MKLLNISSLWYEIPSEFEGSFSDALRFLADYLESDSGKERESMTNLSSNDKDMTVNEYNKQTWDSYCDSLRLGKKLQYSAGVFQVTENEWKDVTGEVLRDL